MEFNVSLVNRISAKAVLPDSMQVVGITGPSGAGKSSLLRALAGFEPEATVSVNWFGEGAKSIANAKAGSATKTVNAINKNSALAPVRVGLVFQQPMLFPHVNVKGNLALAQRHAGSKALALEHALAGCECEHLLHKSIDSLSGGEAQRVALARALVNGPDVLMLDESLSALDATLRSKILRFLVKTCGRLNIKLIMVSHDVQDLALFCDGLIAIVDGVVDVTGSVAYVMAKIASQGSVENPCAILEGEIIRNSDDFPHPFTRLNVSGNILYAKATVQSDNEQNNYTEHGLNSNPRQVRGKIAVFASEVSIDTNTQVNVPSSSILNALPCEVVKIYHPKILQSNNPQSNSQQLQTAIVILTHGDQTLYARVSTLSIERLKLEPGLSVVARFKLQ
ncbi:ATP-binding cassette domain-containing protein [Alteromonas sp. CI.11.F.A3]|uniref:ATP-binding cassette domain-containing protein n=1 Tax=Alteromonas sp. CI.11.F.A3 TaxID=3079555 RepID=UPI0029437CFF|nr:ATP-binding cassette domain-containing protein [Alteromonas sp. CI.11.F.A3]WOI39230.1 ATP-binding cassette domain-containing protein [Alteromonas sp. CI.11.F.A3]